MRFFGISFPFQGRGGNNSRHFAFHCFQNGREGCRRRLQLPCRLLAGGLCKSPQNGASHPHTFGSLSFSLSEIKIKQIPDGAPYSTGRGDTLLRFLQGKPSSRLFLAPPLMASTNRHPALHLGTHIHPQTRTKAYPHCWDFSKLQHASNRASNIQFGTRKAGLGSPCAQGCWSGGSISWGQPGEGPVPISPFLPSLRLHFDTSKTLKYHLFRKGGKDSQNSGDGQRLINC